MLAVIWGLLVEGLGHGLSSHVWWQCYAEDLGSGLPWKLGLRGCCCLVTFNSLCDSMDYSLSGSSVHGLFQARILECIAISSCRGSSATRDQNCISCIAGRFFTTEPSGMPL